MIEQYLKKPFVASELCDTDSMKPTYQRTDLLITRAVPVESDWYMYGRCYVVHALQGVEICRYVLRISICNTRVELQGVEICRYVGRLKACTDGYLLAFDNTTFAPLHLTKAQVISICRVIGYVRMEE